MEKNGKKGLNINARTFVTAIAVIFVLMLGTYLLSFIIPGGEYARTVDANGYTVIDSESGFRFVEGGIPFFKWLFSPFLVLGSPDGGMLIAVLIFLIVIGGIFNELEICGLMEYMLKCIVLKYSGKKYALISVTALFFMAMGSFIGSFEECVPMVPIVTALAVSLGWDTLTGVCISLLAAGCGFAAGVFNPFSVGIAQSLAGLPMFSGVWLRAVNFVLIYGLLMLFVHRHAKRIDRGVSADELVRGFTHTKSFDRGLRLFAYILGGGIVIVLSSGFIPALRDYTLIIVAVAFLAAGVAAALVCGMGGRGLGAAFVSGAVKILPAVLMILMASSVKYTLVEASILDTILYYAVAAASGLPKGIVILFIYMIVLVMNFFIASGSAKAFLLMPLIVPLAQLFGISPQLCVMAYAFGDGFSNAFYPTNAALLIALGLADVSYGTWAKHSVKFQAANLLLTSALLLFGLAIGY